MEEKTSIISCVVLHVNEVNLKVNSQIFMSTEEHLGVVSGSMACMDDFFHLEMTKGTN